MTEKEEVGEGEKRGQRRRQKRRGKGVGVDRGGDRKEEVGEREKGKGGEGTGPEPTARKAEQTLKESYLDDQDVISCAAAHAASSSGRPDDC